MSGQIANVWGPRPKTGVQECIGLLSRVDGFWMNVALTLAKLVVSDRSAYKTSCFLFVLTGPVLLSGAGLRATRSLQAS